MTWEERRQAVQLMGFTDRQAGFLVTVMLHAGVCIGRQYCAFARIAYGLYRGGFLNSASVGFIPIRWENGNEKTAWSRKYLEQELLEVSAHRFVIAVQSHPEEIYALVPACARLFSAFVQACSNLAPEDVDVQPDASEQEMTTRVA